MIPGLSSFPISDEPIFAGAGVADCATAAPDPIARAAMSARLASTSDEGMEFIRSSFDWVGSVARRPPAQSGSGVPVLWPWLEFATDQGCHRRGGGWWPPSTRHPLRAP